MNTSYSYIHIYIYIINSTNQYIPITHHDFSGKCSKPFHQWRLVQYLHLNRFSLARSTSNGWVCPTDRPEKNLLGMKNPQMYRYMICISIQNIYNYVYIPGKIYTCFHIHVSTYVYIYIVYIVYVPGPPLFVTHAVFPIFSGTNIRG